MSEKVHTVRLDAPAHEAARKMQRHKVGSLPVVDEEGRLVGMITATDFLRIAQKALEGHPVWSARSKAEVAPGA